MRRLKNRLTGADSLNGCGGVQRFDGGVFRQPSPAHRTDRRLHRAAGGHMEVHTLECRRLWRESEAGCLFHSVLLGMTDDKHWTQNTGSFSQDFSPSEVLTHSSALPRTPVDGNVGYHNDALCSRSLKSLNKNNPPGYKIIVETAQKSEETSE